VDGPADAPFGGWANAYSPSWRRSIRDERDRRLTILGGRVHLLALTCDAIVEP